MITLAKLKKQSLQQKQITETFVEENINITVGATAGSGKTTTLIDLADTIHNKKGSIFLSFSNSVVKELVTRLPQGFKAKTLHSLGYGIILDNIGEVKLDENKYFKLALLKYNEKQNIDQSKEQKALDKKELYMNCFKVQNLCALIRLTLCDYTFESILDLCNYYDLDVQVKHIDVALDIMKTQKMSNTIDFADMLYYPAIYDFNTPKFENVLYDEVQDANKAQIGLLEKILYKDSKLVSVGDRHQTIYGFSGSDVKSFDYLANRENTKLLPLNVCYRCGIDIVEEAKKEYNGRVINDEIMPYEHNQPGIVREIEMIDNSINSGDLVLCRNTSPLISAFYKFINMGKKAKVIGKDIEKGLIQIGEILQLMPNKTSCYSYFRTKETELTEELIEAGTKKPREHQRFRAIKEKHDILNIILNQINRPGQIVAQIKSIFDETKEGITLMTIHRSKGLENDRVFIIDRYKGEQLIPNKHANMDWQIEQEYNLLFVSRTRAKKELVYIKNVEEIFIM
jgi:superfamily I DNA/RNA helicase